MTQNILISLQMFFLRARVRAGVGSVQRLASERRHIEKPVHGRHRILLIFVYKPQPG